MQAASNTTLYERLGGYLGITAVVDDFVERLFGDTRVGGQVQGGRHEAKRNLRLLTVDLLCAASGAPRQPRNGSVWVGRQGLGMSQLEWQWTVQHLTDALARVGLAADDHVAVLQLVSPLEGERLREPAPADRQVDPIPVRRAVAPLAVRVAARAGTLHSAFRGAGGA